MSIAQHPFQCVLCGETAMVNNQHCAACASELRFVADNERMKLLKTAVAHNGVTDWPATTENSFTRAAINHTWGMRHECKSDHGFCREHYLCNRTLSTSAFSPMLWQAQCIAILYRKGF